MKDALALEAEPVVSGLVSCGLERSASPLHAYLNRLSPGASRHTMGQSLEHLAGIASGGTIAADRLPWHSLRYRDTAALRAVLIDSDYKPATVNLRLAALRGVLREAWRLGLMAADDYHRARDLENVRNESLLRGRALPPGEVSALFARVQKDTTVRGARDNAVLAVLYGCGLRRAELVRLRLVDVDLEGETLRVHGKGRRERSVAILEGVRAGLEAWIEVRGRRPGALFVATTPGGTLTSRPLAAGTVRHICRRRAAQGELAPFSPHDLRRSCATELLEQDVDLSTVSRLLGHAELDSTARYDYRGERATRRAATKLHIPRCASRAKKGEPDGEESCKTRGGGRENQAARRRRQLVRG